MDIALRVLIDEEAYIVMNFVTLFACCRVLLYVDDTLIFYMLMLLVYAEIAYH
jgi:hypothetical protein